MTNLVREHSTIDETARAAQSEPEPRSLHHPEVTLSQALNNAELLAERLRSLASSVEPSYLSKQFYHRVRVKSPESIADKITRNRYMYNQPIYTFADLDDIVGFRIVTLYDAELIPSIDYVLNLVSAGQQLSRPIFRGANVWEALQSGRFSLRKEGDEHDRYLACFNHVQKKIAKESKSPAEHSKLVQRRDPSKNNRYSSAHLTFEAVSYPPRKSVDGAIFEQIIPEPALLVPVEFQIRAAHEDIWGEINHRFLYKLESAYVWSPGFHEKLEHVRASSVAFKEIIENLPTAIDAIVARSAAARKELAKFLRPDVDHHFSIGSSLFWAMGYQYVKALGHLFDHYSEANDRLKNNAAVFSSAKRNCKTAEHNNSSARVRATAKRALDSANQSCAESIRAAIVAICAVYSQVNFLLKDLGSNDATDTADEIPQATLLSQRAFLCWFEILRLKALLLVDYRFCVGESDVIDTLRNGEVIEEFVKGDHERLDDVLGLVPSTSVKIYPVNSEGDLEAQAIKLYAEFCKFKDEKELKIRPVSVVFYWKYRLAALFDFVTSRRNLREAYTEYSRDICLPIWSVYRIRIPRDLANDIYIEAATLFSKIQAIHGSLVGLSGVTAEIKSKLVDALRYALEGFREYSSNVHDETGDFTYGLPEQGEAILDAALILKIYSFYYLNFGEFITQSHSINIDKLQEVADYIDNPARKTSHILKAAFSAEEQEHFSSSLSTLRSNLPLERAKQEEIGVIRVSNLV